MDSHVDHKPTEKWSILDTPKPHFSPKDPKKKITQSREHKQKLSKTHHQIIKELEKNKQKGQSFWQEQCRENKNEHDQ